MSPRVQSLHATLAAGTFTALHALYRGSRHPTPLALSAAVNGGIAGAVFFGIREVLVSPILQYTSHPREPTNGTSSTITQFSWSHLRMNHVPESALSGALTGAILNTWQHGRARFWAGARTAGIICTVLQWGFNELGIMRIKFVSHKIQESQPHTPTPPSSSEAPEKPRPTVFDRLMTVIGFRKLSDEEYLKALKQQRNEALERLAVLEQERRENQTPDSENKVS